MKKLLLPLIILATGTVVVARFSQLASGARASTSRCQAELPALSNAVAQLSAESAALQKEIKAGKERLSRSSWPEPLSASLLEALQTGRSNSWPGALLPELRRRLGISWDSSRDYVLVSKAALKRIPLNGAGSRGGLTPTVCDMLAITPDEQARLEALVQRSEATYLGWAQTNVQRIEPTGDIVAKYVYSSQSRLGAKAGDGGRDGRAGCRRWRAN